MPPILGNAIALAAVAALVFVCARFLWLDHRRGGGCAGCGSHGCGGHCAGCAGYGIQGGEPPRIDISALRVQPKPPKG